MAVGDGLLLFNGDGQEYPATVAAIDKKSVTVQTRVPVSADRESPLAIHLGIAISRGDRMDWIAQKATELGVQSITPLLTQRTGVKLKGERAQKKIDHWRQVAISACEQCGRNRLPEIASLQPLADWLESTEATRKFVLHHRTDAGATGAETVDSIALLVGPEGGLSADEIHAAESAGYHSLSLGPRVLRTETAPLAAIAILQARWGDMRL
tara:strand:+ start:80253 stop:80885 length:633 start_codon:yes stop_codon:yes gene_type:complete